MRAEHGSRVCCVHWHHEKTAREDSMRAECAVCTGTMRAECAVCTGTMRRQHEKTAREDSTRGDYERRARTHPSRSFAKTGIWYEEKLRLYNLLISQGGPSCVSQSDPLALWKASMASMHSAASPVQQKVSTDLNTCFRCA